MEEYKEADELEFMERFKEPEPYNLIDILKRDVEEEKNEIKRSSLIIRDDIINIRKRLKTAKTPADIADIEVSIHFSLECINTILTSSPGPLSAYLGRSVSAALWKEAGYDEHIIKALREIHRSRFLGYQTELNDLLQDVRAFIPEEKIPDKAFDHSWTEEQLKLIAKGLQKEGRIDNIQQFYEVMNKRQGCIKWLACKTDLKIFILYFCRQIEYTPFPTRVSGYEFPMAEAKRLFDLKGGKLTKGSFSVKADNIYDRLFASIH